MRTSANEELGTLADNNLLNHIDYQISETSEIFIQESSSDSRPSNLHDLEIDDYTIGRALSSPLFTQEREDPASRRQAYHSLDESLLPSQSLSVCHVRTERPVDEFGSLISNVRDPCRGAENEQIRILLERQKEQTLADYKAEIQKHEFQADYDRRRIQKLNEVIESQRGEIYRAHQGDEQHRRDHQLLHEQLLEQAVAILAQEPFLVRTCTVFFPFTSDSGFALSKCQQRWNGCASFFVTCLLFEYGFP